MLDNWTSLLSPPSSSDSVAQNDDRTELIEKARAFLLSPSVRYEDEAAKRKFLQEKGLTHEEIDLLIQALARQPPPVPPRTYPPPPPSNLPAVLATLFRVFTWTSGISAVLLLGYYRFLFPRISQSLGARHKLQLYHTELLARLKSRLEEVKKTQDEVHNALAPLHLKAPPAGIKSPTELPIDTDRQPTDSHSIPSTTSTPPVSLAQSLESLRDALSRGLREGYRYNHTFKALTDLTGFLSRETYSHHGANLNFRHGFSGVNPGHPLSPAEEDVRREIRALKGLVLNRRSFAPNLHRPSASSGAT